VDDAGRDAALDRWFREHGGRVLAYLLHRTDPDTAQDVLQEVFVIAHRKAEQVPEQPLGWLFGTARRVLANTVRGARRRDAVVDRLSAAAKTTDDLELSELRYAFARTLADLSAADREILTLSAWYDLPPDQAAEALDCSRNAYAVRLHRARRRLADHLERSGYTGPTPAGRLAEALRD
jgi:RNA polymerase sigma-70 factor (ECF subfamily)